MIETRGLVDSTFALVGVGGQAGRLQVRGWSLTATIHSRHTEHCVNKYDPPSDSLS